MDIEKENNSVQKNQAASLVASAVTIPAVAAFFSLHATPILMAFLTSVGKYFLLPVIMAMDIIEAVIAWRQVVLERNAENRIKSHLVVNAVVKTVAAVGVGVAAVGSMFFSAIFGVASAVLFAAVTAFKTLFHMGAALYCCGKAAATVSDTVVCTKHLDRAKEHLVQCAAGTIATVAITVVLVLGKVAMFGLGVASCVFNAIALGAKVYSAFKKNKNTQPVVDSKVEKVVEQSEVKPEQTLGVVARSRPIDIPRRLSTSSTITDTLIRNPGGAVQRGGVEPARQAMNAPVILLKADSAFKLYDEDTQVSSPRRRGSIRN